MNCSWIARHLSVIHGLSTGFTIMPLCPFVKARYQLNPDLFEAIA